MSETTSTRLTPTLSEVERAVSFGVRAPSIHNTQPWRWVYRPGVLELYADRSRQLPALDPDGRSMVLSCGAALELTRLGFAPAGWRTEVDRLPDPDRSPPSRPAAPFAPRSPLPPCRSACRSPGANWPRQRAPSCAGSPHPENGSASPHWSPRPSASSSATRPTRASSTGGPRPSASARVLACRHTHSGSAARPGTPPSSRCVTSPAAPARSHRDRPHRS